MPTKPFGLKYTGKALSLSPPSGGTLTALALVVRLTRPNKMLKSSLSANNGCMPSAQTAGERDVFAEPSDGRMSDGGAASERGGELTVREGGREAKCADHAQFPTLLPPAALFDESYSTAVSQVVQ